MRLAQVFDNLLTNASKYAPGSPIHISLDEDDGRVRIAFRDEGPGIDGEHVDHLFQRFYRVPGKNTSIRGSGLGLYICRQIITAHDGEISVDFDRRKRHNLLHLSTLSIAHRQRKSNQSGGERMTTVLIVDDEPRYLRLMEANLVTEGYNVLQATNGQEAVDLVADKHPDLVFMDIMMPILDGFGACERIREFSNVPIIVVTARGSEADRVRGLDLGADDYVVKPFSATEFLARARAVLRRANNASTPYQQSIFTHSNLRIDFARAEVFKGDKMVFLSATEYRLLLQFAAQHRQRADLRAAPDGCLGTGIPG